MKQRIIYALYEGLGLVAVFWSLKGAEKRWRKMKKDGKPHGQLTIETMKIYT